MNRVPFFGHKRMHRHAKVASRWRRRSAKWDRSGSSATTGRYAAARNPGTERFTRLTKLVRETASQFRNKYGGQAAGWAADAMATARDEDKRRFFRRVVDMLRHHQYAMNPKRRYGSTEERLKAKWSHASRMMDRHETWDPNAKNRRRKKWRSANYRASRQLAKHYRQRRNPYNPKRDGTPTRGEKRKEKYKDYLRSIRAKGEKASAELNKLLGRGVHKPHGEAVLKAPRTDTQEAHPGHYAAELTSDQKFAQESASQIEATMADIRSQMRELEDDDEQLADELSDRLIKLGDQKRALLAKVSAPVATNPRRRNPRYTSPARYRRMSTAQRKRYREALRQLRYTVHSFRI